jgi:hypothetical protein
MYFERDIDGLLKEMSAKYEKIIKTKSKESIIACLCSNANGKKGVDVDLVTITIGDKESIKRYLPNSDGKAFSIRPSEKISPLFILTDSNSGAQLFFERGEDNRPRDIKIIDIVMCTYLNQM